MDESKVSKGRNDRPGTAVELGTYRLEDQVGFVLRKASQRHAAIFLKRMTDQLTPTQWAALVKVAELKSVSQNQLGRDTAMDVATIKGVVDRLIKRGFVTTTPDPDDGRRNLIAMTAEGRDAIAAGLPVAAAITGETLKPLTGDERHRLAELLRKIS
jgi:MarR family transcriptional regulator, lower aerobic nicotinate degradation pathway regulator